MSFYRFEAKVISRGAGRTTINAAAHNTGKSAIKAAAYRMRMALTDEKTGEVHDYSKKFGGAGAEMFLPEGAQPWMRDRQRLWNAVEKADGRINSQLAHDFVASLPYELTTTQRRLALRAFIKVTFTDKGKIADVGYHDYGEHISAKSPKAPEYIEKWKAQKLPFYELSQIPEQDNHPHIAILRFKNGNIKGYALFQPHAHIMVPMRSVDPDGPHGFARLKDRAPKGMSFRQWWSSELDTMRKDWADMLNRQLEAAGRPERVDHRSLADRGIDRVPEPKKGPVATKREREGLDSNAVTDLEAARARNDKLQEIDRRLVQLRAEEAEIVSFIEAKRKRWQMEMEKEDVLDRRTHQRQVNDQIGGFLKAERIIDQSERYKAEFEHEREEALKRRRERDRGMSTGDIADPHARFGQAAEAYDIRRPFSSMAEAAGREGAIFQRQQEELRRHIALERDTLKRESLDLRRQIEANEYMAVTSRRLASISRVVTGDRYSEESARQEERAENFAKKANDLRKDRMDLQERIKLEEQEKQSRERAAAQPRPGKSQDQHTPFSGAVDYLRGKGYQQHTRQTAEASLQTAARDLNASTAPAREMTDKDQRRQAARENFDRAQAATSRERDQHHSGQTNQQVRSRAGMSR